MTATTTTTTTTTTAWDESSDPARHPLAALAASEAFAKTRYRDTARAVWERQRRDAELGGRGQLQGSYLLRDCGAWVSERGNQAVLVRARPGGGGGLGVGAASKVCSLM